MKKKTVIIAMLFSSFIFGLNAYASEYVEKTMDKIHYQINGDWKREYNDGGSVSYYPPDGYNSNGDVCVLFMADSIYISSASEDLQASYDEYESGISSSYTIIKSENCEIAGQPARTITASQKINERDFILHQSIFLYKSHLYSIGYMQETGFEKDFADDYEKILASMKPEKEYTKYTYDNSKIGDDIPSGEYVVFAEKDFSYFGVYADSNYDDILFNDNFSGNSIITVNDGEYLELTNCYMIPIDEDPEIDLTGEGMFKVGLHIPAGEYKLEATDESAYYCIYPDSRQSSIVANDIFESQNYVTVSDGQYLVLDGCKFSETPQKPVKTYTDSDTVKKVQEALNAAGYDCGTPDGVAGSGTKAAIEKYQTDKSLSVTGNITDELLESLGI